MGPKEHVELGTTTVIAEGPDGLLLPGSPLTPEFHELHLPGMEFLSVLGKGGMGVVFLARQQRLDRLVAVKMLAAELANNEAFVARLEREALTLATLSHPNVVGCHDIISTDQGRFLIMEYVPGQLSVGGLLLRFHKLPEAIALRIAVDVARGLSSAHEKGITHRDIKPDNLQFYWDTRVPPRKAEDLYRFPNSRVMICDFGIALTERTRELHTTKAIGSPLYMAPEQYISGRGQVDHRTDIYALGVTLYHMLTGHLPFAGETREETLKLKAQTDIPDPREREKTISERTARIVQKMAKWQCEERYDNYPELIAELEAALHEVDPEKSGLRGIMPHIPFLWGLAIGGACFFAVGAFIGARRLAELFVSPPVSRTASLGYWGGDRSNWRMAQADAEMKSPAIMTQGGAGPMTLRQKLNPGTRVQLKARIPITGRIHISLVDENDVEHWRFSWLRLHQEGGYMCTADGQAIPLPEIETPAPMDWLDVDFRLGTKRIVLLVNGEMTSVIPLKDKIDSYRLRLQVQSGLIAQFRDLFITREPKQE
jgi:tRNA A-37 threonylcarbamoyl transferase component Bud32